MMTQGHRASNPSRELANRASGEPHLVPWPVELAAAVLCKRWKPGIVWFVFSGRARFGELAKGLPGVSAKVLTQQPRELEREGPVRREAQRGASRRVIYTLTDVGRHLATFLNEFADGARGTTGHSRQRRRVTALRI